MVNKDYHNEAWAHIAM